MSTSRHIDKICCIVLALCVIIAAVFCCGERIGIQASAKVIGYETRLFDTSRVHTIDIVMDDWDSFIENCEDEEYEVCAAVIDGEAYKNIAIRAKGNTSLSSVSSYGNNRYSFKIEFDHYDSTNTYHGLDKLSLNNIIQDNTYMKDYLVYQMMNYMGADAPLCSFAYITVNGEDWGLYLAVEAVEDSFLSRNYNSIGNLYKPDSTSMGGGRGNGGDFDMEEFEEKFSAGSSDDASSDGSNEAHSFGGKGGFGGNAPNGGGNMAGGGFGGNHNNDNGGGNGGFSMGSDDVKLVYTDDDFDSYSNIFDNAKTDISDSDKERLIASLKTLNEGTDIESVVDIDEVIHYFVVHNFVCNFDSYTGSMIHNYYLYENDGVLSMIPWDYNLAFGGFSAGSSGGSDATSMINFPIDSPVSGGTTESRPMLAWIFADEEYTELYHEIFSEFITEYFDSGYFEDMIDSVIEMISPYVEKDPTKFCTYDEFLAGVDTLKEFCMLRAESVSGQLNGTIPSTSDGQSADSSSLIDGSGISLSDMGSMNNGGGKGGMNGGDFGNRHGTFDASETSSDIISKQQFSAANSGFDPSQMQEDGTPPEMPQDGNTPPNGEMPQGGGTPPDGEMPDPPDNSDGDFTPPDMDTEYESAETSAVAAETENAATTAATVQNPPESPAESSTVTSVTDSTGNANPRQDTAPPDESNENSADYEVNEDLGNGGSSPDNSSEAPQDTPDSNNPRENDSEPSSSGQPQGEENAPSQNNSSSYSEPILLGISVVVLAVGIAFAAIFKDRT
ncbi:MAG: CotH kinase family protein [Oscillospiraceae bacterium]|nr:CotH kinase family protein [Oscillospiraceae bacterium]